MGDNLKGLLIFSAGVGVGVAISWKLMKDKYEQIANEEIESVKEIFSKKKKPEEEPEQEPAEEKEETSNERVDYSKMVHGLGYSSEVQKPDPGVVAHVIEPNDFGELEGYDKIFLSYYADGYLAYDSDELVENVDIIGWETLEHIGEYEDDILHVQNDDIKVYFEITKDLRNYYGDIVPKEEE